MTNAATSPTSAARAPRRSARRRGSSSASPATPRANVGQNARRREVVAPAFGEGDRDGQAADDGRDRERDRRGGVAPLAAEPARRAREHEEQPGRRARPDRRERQHRREREHRRPPPSCIRAQPREQRQGDPECERDAPDEHVRHDARGEQPRGQPRPLRLAPRDDGEARHRDHAGDEPQRERAEQRGQRPEQQRVAGLVMAAVPLGVPDREALPPPQPGAVLLRREVGGRRVDDEPGDAERQRAEHGPDDAGHRGLRRARPGRARPGRDAARSECVLHGHHGIRCR